jgi:flagellar hook-length control protein FliK
MTLASIETSSPTASSAKIDFLASPNTPNARAESKEFGQIMSGVMQTGPETPAQQPGQEMAMPLSLQDGFPGSLGGDLLKAIHLGPHLNVITSEATVPDEQSLEAFARSQGLDETAVQWLMGSTPAVTVTTPTPVLDVNALQIQAGGKVQAMADLGTTSALSAMDPNNPSDAAAPLGGFPSPSGLEAVHPALTALNLNKAAPSPMGATDSEGLPLATPTLTTPSAGPNGGDSVSPAEGDLLPNVMNAAALWAMSQATEKARVTSAATEDPAEVAKIQINLMASPAPAAFWMLRHPLAVASGKEAPPPSNGIASSEIDLTQTATPELLDSLNLALAEGGTLSTASAAGDQPAPLSGHPGHRLESAAAARQDAQNPNSSASAPESGNAQRSENVQNLSEKMGQAVGQRILSEIEKGQWHLKLSLRPATLGHIEVEMRMRSGELDAVFTAPQALTRELLQEGMSKLKDTLNQMGMDVASMQVGDGQTSKRGGESTPGQMSKSTKDGADDSKSNVSAVQPSAPRMKMGQDGWDVLV